MKFLIAFLVLCLLVTVDCWTYLGHYVRRDASQAVFDGIKADL